MNTDGHEVLALPRGWLMGSLLAACLFPAFAVLRALFLSIYFEPTEEALYAARVGKGLRAPSAVALVVLVAIAVGIRWTAPLPTATLTAGIMVAITTLLGLTGLAWIRADHALHPFGSELHAVAAFVPPPGATRKFDSRMASDHPEVTRYWNLGGPAQAACGPTLARFRTWADPDTVSNLLPSSPTSCYFQGRRGEDLVQLNVFDPLTGPTSTSTLSIQARRT